MIRKYLPDDDAREQLRSMRTGSWVERHGVSTSWQNLLNAIDAQVALLKAENWNEAGRQWRKQVGVTQRLLPVHVVNEYCHPTRPLEPCPDFNVAPLPRARATDEGEWYTASYNGGKLGETFAYCRSNMSKAVAGVRGYWGILLRTTHDLQACQTLLVTRTQQRDELIAELDPPLGPKAYRD